MEKADCLPKQLPSYPEEAQENKGSRRKGKDMENLAESAS